jgi:hypothetical protein
MHFDYDRHDWTFIARIMDENSRRLSRTRCGRSDTSSSDNKLPLLLSGEALRARSACNEQQVQRFIFSKRQDPKPQNPEQLQQLLYAIADMTNDGLLPAGKLRDWPIAAEQVSASGEPVSGPEPKVSPEELPSELQKFALAVFERRDELETDPVPLAAWAEWELNGGRLHPFYDGCGRIARSFTALLLLRGSWLLPLHESLAEYFAQGNRGTPAFAAYMRKQIAACARWIPGEL